MSTTAYLPTQATALPSSQTQFVALSGSAGGSDRNEASGAAAPQEFAAVLRDSGVAPSGSAGKADAPRFPQDGDMRVPVLGIDSAVDGKTAWKAEHVLGNRDPANGHGIEAPESQQAEEKAIALPPTSPSASDVDAVMRDSAEDQAEEEIAPGAPLACGVLAPKDQVLAKDALPTGDSQGTTVDEHAHAKAADRHTLRSGAERKAHQASDEWKGKTKTKAAEQGGQGSTKQVLAAYGAPAQLPWLPVADARGADRMQPAPAAPKGAALTEVARPTGAVEPTGSSSIPMQASVGQAASPAAPDAMQQTGAPGQGGPVALEQVGESDAVAMPLLVAQAAGRSAPGHAVPRAGAKVQERAQPALTAARVEDASGALLKPGSVVPNATQLSRAEVTRAAEPGPASDRAPGLQTVALPEHGSAMRAEPVGRSGQIELRIDDAALGPVHVQATLDGNGGVRVGIAGQHDDAHAALEQIAPLLAAAVTQQAESHGSTAATVHVITAADRVAESTGSGMFPTVRLHTSGASVSNGEAFTGGFDGTAQQRPSQQNAADGSRQARIYRQQFGEESGDRRGVPAVGFAATASWNNARSGGLSVRI